MATLSDQRATRDFIAGMRCAGTDAFRINSAHVSPKTMASMVKLIKSVDPDIGILMDTKGPEIRTTECETPMPLAEGDTVELRSSAECEKCRGNRIFTCVDEIHRYLEPETNVLLDDGMIAIRVERIDGQTVIGQVMRGGILDSRKTIAFDRGELPPLPPVSEHDRQMIEAAREIKIDMIAHSFVRSANDINAVRRLIEGTDISLFAKIECRSAIKHLDDIMTVADGILVARGDLGTALPLSEIPATQYHIMNKCHSSSTPTIVSTQILQSMISSPQPTRAEVNDIALAVMEGADWLLLCGETAQGAYPEKCVEVMRHTIDSIYSNNLQCKII